MSRSTPTAFEQIRTNPLFTAHIKARQEFRTVADVFAINPSAHNFLKLEAAAVLLQDAQWRLDEHRQVLRQTTACDRAAFAAAHPAQPPRKD